MKPDNQYKLISLVAFAEPIEPDFTNMSLEFDVFAGHNIMGTASGMQIKLYACTLLDLHKDSDPISLGRHVASILAHEFRHTQQYADDTLPQVQPSAQQLGLGIYPAGYSDQAYNTDPGEQDANAYASLASMQLPDRQCYLLYRLTRFIASLQYKDWFPFILNRWGC